jgi:hypothetical protein
MEVALIGIVRRSASQPGSLLKGFFHVQHSRNRLTFSHASNSTAATRNTRKSGSGSEVLHADTDKESEPKETPEHCIKPGQEVMLPIPKPAQTVETCKRPVEFTQDEQAKSNIRLATWRVEQGIKKQAKITGNRQLKSLANFNKWKNKK